MKRLTVISVLAALVLTACNGGQDKAYLNKAVKAAGEQLKYQAELFDTLNCYPRSFNGETYHKTKHADWTCGFFPGSLWLEYQLTGDEAFKEAALKYTARIEDATTRTGTHDLGFMTFCSFGKQYEVLGDSASAAVIVESARTLAQRFDPQVGLIRSWDFGDWNYPVIIDNMMNLEMLFWASEYTGDESFRQIAVTHADNTLKNHFRSDCSSYHVVSYNNDGSIESKGTYQGYSDESAWSRGQAWGLYGYTVCYRYTKDEKYLDHAQKIADFIMSNPAMPEDLVPVWDYNAPGTGNELCEAAKADSCGLVGEPLAPARDASAAAIVASALIELSGYVDGEDGCEYLDYARRSIKSLCSDSYLAESGTNGGFVLRHSTGAASLNSEIDVPINYADYYFLEAIHRLK